MDTVSILSSEREVKLLFDPMRLEILRLLSRGALTSANIARSLNLTTPTVGHHLNALKQAGMVQAVGTEPEEHGIIQKFYRASAAFRVIDGRKLSPPTRRYFIPVRIERTRGIMAALALMGDEAYRPTSSLVEKTTEDFATSLVEVARRHQGPYSDVDPEHVVGRLYKEALANLYRTRPQLFPRVLQAVKG